MSLPLSRSPSTSDVERIKQIAVEANMFGVDEVGLFDEMLAGFFDGSLVDHHWLVVEDPSHGVVAAAHYAPERFADRMWNLYFIAVAPRMQGHGLGGLLLTQVEVELKSSGEDIARVLTVETSSTDQYAQTRTFYRNHGYREEARISQFYGAADDKVVFWKSLGEST